ncbi:hypothetical protein [Bacillus suaedaesalsae]|uniref:DUF4352 domain-containing protein n=1 Tax=Bacillus suaedaesalsae TaxID=2810349 RepID=A0ABS2DFT5_9BACI|nr:hypothetical protein [Bacillus suaedaesalsae]MBM6617281.1 hypothetical protein [Bacillus suaedaesalsae]
MRNFTSAFTLAVLLISAPHFTKANSMKEPVVLESGEWTLTLGNPEVTEEEHLAKGNKNAVVYSLGITNKSGQKYNVRVHTFRKEQGKSYDFGMSLHETEGIDMGTASEQGNEIKHVNFPVGKKTKEFEVLITWQDKEEFGRFYKQEFIVPVK